MIRKRKNIRHYLRETAGGTLILTAVVFPAVIGFSGLALDGAHWYAQRRSTQNMADAAAVAGAYAKVNQEGLDGITSSVLQEAVKNGYEDVADNTLTVLDVSSSAGTAGVSRPLVDVTIERRVRLYFANAFIEDTAVTIAARAVSGVRNLGPQCVIALNETASRAVEFTGNTTADIGCGVASNSDNSEALYVGGSAILLANPAQAFGDIAVEGSGQLISQLPPLPFSPRVEDPFAGLPPPPVTSCDESGNLTVSDASQLMDADGDGYITVCGDLEFRDSVDLDSGTYIVRNGDYSTKGGTSVTGTDVTFILTGDSPDDVGSVHLNNNTTMMLTAPMTGTYAGILFYQDPDAVDADRSLFNGGVNLELDGVIYMPASAVDFAGGASNPDNCLQIVADTVSFTGNSFIRNDPMVCSDLGLAVGGTTQRQVVLLE